MNHEKTLQERSSEAFDALKERINMEEARRLLVNGKRVVKTHPVAAVAVSLSAGILLGYLAKTLVDRHRGNGVGAVS